MMALENSTLSCRWRNNLWHTCFSISPKVTGKHNIVFKGRAFSFSVLENVKIVVKCLTSDVGEPRSAYTDRSEQAKKIAATFNKIISTWNDTGIATRHVTFVEPACAVVDERTKFTKIMSNVHIRKDESVVFEKRLSGKFTQFISDDGKLEELNNQTEIVDAFCHFTFLVSEGKIVICGLKGIYDKNRDAYRLTNPTVHSKEGRFGSKDMGERGIKMFCRNHVCNKLCRRIIKSYKRGCSGRIQVWKKISSGYTVTLPPLSTPKPLIPTAPFPKYVDEPFTPYLSVDPPPPYPEEDMPPPYQLEWAHTSYMAPNLLVQTLNT